MSSRPSLQLFESRTPSPAVSKTIPAKGRPCYPSGPAFVHFGGEALVEAGRWHAGRGVAGWAQTRRAGDARCGGLAGRSAASRRRKVRRGTGAHQGVGAGCGAAVVRADIAWFCVGENTPYLWHFAPERSSFSVNGFAILFMNNYEYRIDMRKQLNGEYNVNN